MYEGPTKLCIFEGIMNAELYIKILEECLVPFLQETYPHGQRFMQDNDPKHTSHRDYCPILRQDDSWIHSN